MSPLDDVCRTYVITDSNLADESVDGLTFHPHPRRGWLKILP